MWRPCRLPSQPKLPQRRTLMVVDFDNLRIDYERYNKRRIDWVTLLIMLRLMVGADERYLYVSYYGEDVLQRWSDCAAAARYYFEPYRTERGHGYADSELIDRVMVEAPNFQRIVIVSSDSDFWPCLLQLHRYFDCETVLMTNHANPKPHRKMMNELVADFHVPLAEIIQGLTLPEAA